MGVRDYIDIVASSESKDVNMELIRNTKELLQALPDDVLADHLNVAAVTVNGGFYHIELKIPFELINSLISNC